MVGLYSNYEQPESPFEGDSDIDFKANAYNVRRILRKRGGPRGKNWFIIGQYLMNSDMFDDMGIAELAWRAQDYEGVPPFGDHEAMKAWDEAQAAREALKRTARKVLRQDMEARSN